MVSAFVSSPWGYGQDRPCTKVHGQGMAHALATRVLADTLSIWWGEVRAASSTLEQCICGGQPHAAVNRTPPRFGSIREVGLGPPPSARLLCSCAAVSTEPRSRVSAAHRGSARRQIWKAWDGTQGYWACSRWASPWRASGGRRQRLRRRRGLTSF